VPWDPKEMQTGNENIKKFPYINNSVGDEGLFFEKIAFNLIKQVKNKEINTMM
jgi:hypothetical protein